MRPTEQRIADIEARLARLQERSRKDHTRQMILLGATLFAEAQRAPGFRRWVITKLEAAMKPTDEAIIRQLIARILDTGGQQP